MEVRGAWRCSGWRCLRLVLELDVDGFVEVDLVGGGGTGEGVLV